MAIAWTEMMSTSFTVSTGAWRTYDIFTNKSVPKSSVALILMVNASTSTNCLVGVRNTDSAIENHYVELHEAEGDGVVTATMYVQVNASGNIDVYQESASGAFYVLGYWTGTTFTDVDLGDYAPVNLSTFDPVSVPTAPASRVCQFILGNRQENAATTLGIRTSGSALATRYRSVHEAESDEATATDVECYSVCVKNGTDSKVECYSTDGNDRFYLVGYFGSEMDYVEANPVAGTIGSASAWNSWDLTAYMDVNGRVCDIVAGHAVSNAQHSAGVSKAGGASTRYITLHEAEANGEVGACFVTETDANGVLYIWLSTTADEQFDFFGYYKPAPSTQTVTDTASVTDAVKVHKTLAIVDAAALTENVEVESPYKIVAETLSASEAPLVNKSLTTSLDSIFILDSILAPARYAVSHVISQTAGAGTNYQVQIRVENGEYDGGSGYAVTVPCLADYTDVVFMDSNFNQIDAWCEDKFDNFFSEWWVEIPGNLTDGDVTIYVGWGGNYVYPFGDDLGEFEATFLLADYFDGAAIDEDKWNIVGTPSIGSSVVECGDEDVIYSKTSFATGHSIRASLCIPDNSFSGLFHAAGVGWGYYDGTTCPLTSVAAITTDTNKYWLHERASCFAQDNYDMTRALPDSTLHTCDLRRTSTKSQLVQVAETETDTTTSHFPTDSRPAAIWSYNSGENGYVQCDWLCVRKYVDTEPAHGAWGAAVITLSSTNAVFLTESFALAEALLVGKSPLTLTEAIALVEAISKQVEVEVTDASLLADALLLNKTLYPTDNVGLIDVPRAHKTLYPTDALTFFDQEVLLAHKTLYPTDSISISDWAGPGKGLMLTDALALSEAILKHGDAHITDSAALAEALYINKTLFPSETLGLVDAAKVNKTLFPIDSLALSDAQYILKTLPITDVLALTEALLRGGEMQVADYVEVGSSPLLYDDFEQMNLNKWDGPWGWDTELPEIDTSNPHSGKACAHVLITGVNGYASLHKMAAYGSLPELVVEHWLYLPTTDYDIWLNLMNSGNTAYIEYKPTAAGWTMQWRYSSGAFSSVVNTGIAVTTGQWIHVIVTMSRLGSANSKIELNVDGDIWSNDVGQITTATKYFTGLNWGAYTQGAEFYVDDVSISAGVEAIYAHKGSLITDSGLLTDAPKVDKTFYLTEVASLAEQLVLGKNLTVEDALALALEVIDVAISGGNQDWEIPDTIALAEAILVHSNMSISEAISLAESFYYAFNVNDTSTLGETPYADKGLVMSETGLVSDAPYADKGLILTEAGTAADASYADKGLILTDPSTITDVNYAHKTLPMTETSSLADALLANKNLQMSERVLLGTPEFQLTGTSGAVMSTTTYKRHCQRKTLTNKYVTALGFKLRSTALPAGGDIYARIRKVSDDSVIAGSEQVIASASSVPNNFGGTWYYATYQQPVYVNQEVRLCVEWTAPAAGQIISVQYSDANPKAGELKGKYEYSGSSWSDESSEDLVYHIVYEENVLAHKGLILTDAELLTDVPYAHKTLYPTDALASTDAPLVHKTLYLMDSGTLTEGELVGKGIIITDDGALLDVAFVSKQLDIVMDDLAMTEVIVTTGGEEVVLVYDYIDLTCKDL